MAGMTEDLAKLSDMRARTKGSTEGIPLNNKFDAKILQADFDALERTSSRLKEVEKHRSMDKSKWLAYISDIMPNEHWHHDELLLNLKSDSDSDNNNANQTNGKDSNEA